ncbi:MAG: alginate export family protein [Proteobacteria bacterium]|nr:alginate export family protein [Pseudomonadota bacterium]
MSKTVLKHVTPLALLMAFSHLSYADDAASKDASKPEADKEAEEISATEELEASSDAETTQTTESNESKSDAAVASTKNETAQIESTSLKQELANEQPAETGKEKDTIPVETEDDKPDTASEDKDPLVFGNTETVWGKLALHYRLRPEFRQNADLDSDEKDESFVGWQRARVGLGLNYSSWLKAFVQFQDCRTVGFLNSSVAYGGNTDLHKAWVRLGFADDLFTLKIGRQQLVYGDQRLIGHLEWVNQSRLFDAAVLSWNNSIGRLDLFASVFSADPGGNLVDYSTVFFGLYNAFHFMNKAIVWDQYLLGLVDGEDARRPGELFDPEDTEAVSPSRKIGTVGTRIRYNGKSFATGAELAYQFGKSVSDDNILDDMRQNALALHADAKYTLPIPWKPFVRAELNFATGNRADEEDETGRFINLFPTNHLHYGYMDLQNWSNTLNGSVGTGFTPVKYFALSIDYWLLARASTDDGWFNAGGKQLLPPPDPDSPTDHDDEALLGHELDFTIKTPIIKQLKVVTGFSLFSPTGYALDKGEDVQIWAFTMLVVNL